MAVGPVVVRAGPAEEVVLSPPLVRERLFRGLRGPVTGGLERVITGAMVSDVVPCFGSLNMIGGECDR